MNMKKNRVDEKGLQVTGKEKTPLKVLLQKLLSETM